MLLQKRMPGSLSESRQPESTRQPPGLPGMRLRPIESFPGQPCRLRGREGPVPKAREGGGFRRRRWWAVATATAAVTTVALAYLTLPAPALDRSRDVSVLV